MRRSMRRLSTAEWRHGLKPEPSAPEATSAWSRWLTIGRAQKQAFDAAGALPAEPAQVLLFSGHMVDAPGRKVPRFPAGKVDAAAARIETLLAQLDAGSDDLAFTQGAAGGDLLFAEACLARDMPLQLLLPLARPEFVRQSLRPSADGGRWQGRFEAVEARCPVAPIVMHEAVPERPGPDNVFEQCNLWLLATALAYGIGRLRFICLWDGAGGDGPGGTRHLVDEVRRMGGQSHWIDVRTL
jgi:hypothetical protein